MAVRSCIEMYLVLLTRCRTKQPPLPPPLPSPCPVQLRLTTKANGGVEKKNMKKNQLDRHLTGNPACAPQRCPRTEAQPHNFERAVLNFGIYLYNNLCRGLYPARAIIIDAYGVAC